MLNANARVWSRWKEGRAIFEGSLSLVSAVIRHPKLSANPVGPFNLSAKGVLNLEWTPGQPKQFKLSVEKAQASLGHIKGRLDASWDQRQAKPHLRAQFEVPRLPASHFAASIPQGLMPHLQPIELAGKIGFRGGIDLNLAKLDDTKLTFKPDLRRLKVKSFNATFFVAGFLTVNLKVVSNTGLRVFLTVRERLSAPLPS